MLNSTLLKEANKVIASKLSGQYRIKIQFTSSSSASAFSFVPQFGCQIKLNRDYAENFADELDLVMKISPKDYALLQDQGQDLLCTLTITQADKYGKALTDPAPKMRQYRVIINDPRDIRKAVPDIHAYTEPSVEMSVRLLEETLYTIRQNKINGIFQKADVKSVIHAVAQQLGITKIHLFEPDNKHVFDHIVIDDFPTIGRVFSKLQKDCGIYFKGINAYICDDVLYVYPPFETNIQYDRSVMFYNVDKGRYAGNHVFHNVESPTKASIVVAGETHAVDLSITGAENVGTGVIFNRASRRGANLTTIDSQSGAQFTTDPALAVSLKDTRTAMSGNKNSVYINATDNAFPPLSKLASTQASLVTLQWMNADPWLLDPCHAVQFHYDENGVMVSKYGIIERAFYALTMVTRVDSEYLYSAVGALTLRLSMNATKTY